MPNRNRQKRRITIRFILIIPLIFPASTPAAAAHGDLDCEVPASMEPLFALLDSLVQLTFVLGLSLGLLGFMTAGVAFMIPGEDNNRRGKQIAKAVFIGMLLLLSAHFIVSFLVNELGGVVCQ